MSGGEDKIQNVFFNLVEPANFKTENQITGTLSNIAAEVLLSKVIRRVLRMEQKGFIELGTLHLISQPFLGGLFFGEGQGRAENSTAMQAATDGAKQTPAVLIAAYILSVAGKGFNIPGFNIRDILITLAGKIGTRLIITQTYKWMPGILQRGFVQHDNLVNAQKASSSLVGK